MDGTFTKAHYHARFKKRGAHKGLVKKDFTRRLMVVRKCENPYNKYDHTLKEVKNDEYS